MGMAFMHTVDGEAIEGEALDDVEVSGRGYTYNHQSDA